MADITPDDIDACIARIARRLEQLVHRKLEPFGLSGHGCRFEPTLTELEIAETEATYGIALPEGYRRFTQRISNGGIGPAYGLLSLAEGLAYDGEPASAERLQEPFEYTRFHDATSLLNHETDEYPPRPGSITVC